MNAKKLDIDFGGDDFFDSFGMSENAPIDIKPASSELKNDNPFSAADKSSNNESGPFQIGSGASNYSKAGSADNDTFVKNKLKELEGK